MFDQSARQVVLLPLATALSATTLTACTTPPLGNGNTAITTRIPTVVNNPNAIYSQNNQNNTFAGSNIFKNNGALLDQESLNELSGLIEATDMSMVENDQNLIVTTGNLWDRVRQGYGISRVNTYNPKIEAQKSWFVNNQNYLNKMTARASRYLFHTTKEAEYRGLPTELALLPIIESSYDPIATSTSGAKGLWQFMSATGKQYGLNQTASYDGRRDVIESTNAAYDYLTDLYNQFNSWELALAAYNAGPATVQNAINANRQQNLPTDFWSLNLPVQTQNYVPRFLAVSEIIANPSIYGIILPAIANNQHFSTIPVSNGVSIADVAQVAGVPYQELQLLNPGLIKGRVDNTSPPRIVVPNSLTDRQIGNVVALSSPQSSGISVVSSYGNNSTTTNDIFRPKPFIPNSNAEQLANYANAASVGNVQVSKPSSVYVVKYGESLTSIAQKTGVSASQLASWNNLNINSALTAGSMLYLYNSRNVQAPVYGNNNIPSSYGTSNNYYANTKANKPDYYIVQNGNTLIGTAQKFGLTAKQLANYNNLTTKSNLRRGQKLWLIPGQVRNTQTVSQPSTKTSSNQVSTTRYRVQSGDTLIGIAKKLGTTRDKIASVNSFGKEYRVRKGEYIRLPASSELVNARLKNRPTMKSSSSTKVSRPTSYKVRNGDTLIGVANKLGVSVSNLAAANNLTTKSDLVRGATLIVPTGNVSRINTSNKSIRRTVSYKVKSGDSLTNLAKRYDTNVPALAKINNFSTNSELRIGQVIKVPVVSVPYTVRSGDSLIGLASRYGVSTQKLATLNNISADSKLKIGQIIRVPN